MLNTFRTLSALFALALLLVAPLTAGDHSKMDHSTMDHSTMDHSTMDHSNHQPPPVRTGEADGLRIPSLEVVDQDGHRIDFRDLVGDKMVAMSFVFTTCTTVCPPIGANFGRLQKLLGDADQRDVQLISVSVDPINDTPERLQAWGKIFGADEGWSLVTGERGRITELLKALQVFTPDIREHSATVLLGNAATGRWTRADGLAPAQTLVDILNGLREPVASASTAGAETVNSETVNSETVAIPTGADDDARTAAARGYFTDTELVDQDGRKVRFYEDMLRGKTVVIDAFFTTCNGICPVMGKALQAVQKSFGDHLGEDLFLISITLDPEHDTPAVLSEYAERLKAGPGWSFLTGPPEQVEHVLAKLGQAVEVKEGHQAVLLVGNESTGLWKKAFGLAQAESIVEIVASVLGDTGEANAAGEAQPSADRVAEAQGR